MDSNSATVTVTVDPVNDPPVVTGTPGPFAATGNIQISVPVASGLLSSVTITDVDGAGAAPFTVGGTVPTTTVNGGNLSINTTTGSFTYNPPPGFEGSDSFQYKVCDSGVPGSACSAPMTVMLNVSDMIWFVDTTAAAGGDGRLNNPFDCLVGSGCFDPLAVDGPGDNIFLADGSYTGGLTLLNNQKLIGDGSSGTLDDATGITLAPNSDALPTFSGTDPTITTTNTTGITLGTGNTIRGLSIGNTGTGTGIKGNFGTLTVRETTVNGTGEALDLANGALDAIFDNVSSSSGTTAVNLDTVTGSFQANAGTITGSTGPAFRINAGNADVTYSGSINNTSGRAVEVTNRTGGTTTFQTGTITDTVATGIRVAGNSGGTINFNGTVDITNSTGAGVTLASNTGGTFSFADLDITNTTSNQKGLLTTGTNTGATLNTTTGTINTGSGTAIDLDNIALGMTLTSVSVNGATNGVIVENTTGSFTVTGNGATQLKILPDGTSETVLVRNGSGGTLNTTGTAVSLVSANGVTLRQMDIPSPGGDGVNSSGGSDIVLSAVSISTPTNNGWFASNLAGTSGVDNDSLITGINANTRSGIRIHNTNTNLTLFEINNSDFTNSNSGQSMVLFEQFGTSNMRLDVEGSLFEGLFSQAVTAAAGQSAGTTGTMTTNIGGPDPGDGNTFQNASTAGNGGENNAACLVANGATQNCLIQGNLFDDITKDGSIANTSVIRTQNNGGTWDGEVSDNTIRNINIQFPATFPLAGGRHGIGHVFEPPFTGAFSTNLIIDGNTIDDLPTREAIFIDFRANAGDGDVTITNNAIGQDTGTFGSFVGPGKIGGSQQAIEIRSRGNTKTVNLLIDNNTVTATTSSRFLDIDSEDNGTVNATITNNAFTNVGAGDEIDVDSEDAASTFCADIRTNVLDSGAGDIRVEEAGGGATLDVVQTSAANLASVNGIPSVIVVGTPNFGEVASCTLPSP